jgi:hypothetical protein
VLAQAVSVFKLAQNANAGVAAAVKPAATVTHLPARETLATGRQSSPARTRKVAGSDI